MRLLLIDIETAPNVADLWQLWGNQHVSINQLRQSSYMLCWAAKWYGERKMFFRQVSDDDMLSVAWELINEADVLVTYNGDRFDIPTLNKEFLLAGLSPPAPFKSVDLYKVVRRRFKFPSNKLAYVSEALGIGSKLEHEGHSLWVKAMAGDVRAQKRMARYCRQDTKLLEPLHDRLLPWITAYPNRRLFDGGNGCISCGSEELVREGYAYTAQGRFQRFSCRACGKWMRGSKRIDSVDIQGVV